MVGGEDCLSVASSAAAPDAALRLKEISGGRVAFSFPYFFWLSKRNRVASHASATCHAGEITPLTDEFDTFLFVMFQLNPALA